ncbi:MAG TPA: phosphoribosyltransferase family protein [Caulobacteraceae bacterium]|nr:phosphoribosyltransferase family protein [Caulobacteraceae bacterium]
MKPSLLADPEVLLSAEDIAARIERMAADIEPLVESDTVAVCLLTGGLWFAADLTRALARRGKHLPFDALWLTSYGEHRVSSGRCEVRAGLQRPVEGRKVLLIDDVFDSGLSLSEGGRIVMEHGAREVFYAVFASKPWPEPRALKPHFVGWEAPARFLVGYGMDAAGDWRGLPYIGALD